MSQVIKAFTGLFIVLFLMTASTGILGVFYQMLHAQNTHAEMLDELENSNYARPVIEACFEIAEKEKYRLQLSFYSETQTSVICTEVKEIPEDLSDISVVEVILFYDVEVVFFKIAEELQLFGYAR